MTDSDGEVGITLVGTIAPPDCMRTRLPASLRDNSSRFIRYPLASHILSKSARMQQRSRISISKGRAMDDRSELSNWRSITTGFKLDAVIGGTNRMVRRQFKPFYGYCVSSDFGL